MDIRIKVSTHLFYNNLYRANNQNDGSINSLNCRIYIALESRVLFQANEDKPADMRICRTNARPSALFTRIVDAVYRQRLTDISPSVRVGINP